MANRTKKLLHHCTKRGQSLILMIAVLAGLLRFLRYYIAFDCCNVGKMISRKV